MLTCFIVLRSNNGLIGCKYRLFPHHLSILSLCKIEDLAFIKCVNYKTLSLPQTFELKESFFCFSMVALSYIFIGVGRFYGDCAFLDFNLACPNK